MALHMDSRSVLQTCLNNLNSLEVFKNEHLKNNSFETFNLEEFWKKMVNISRVVSHEASKFCLAFNKHPLPEKESCIQLATGLETACIALVSTSNELPKEHGTVLQAKVKDTVMCIISAVKDLIPACLTAVTNERKQLIAAGNVWECCEAIDQLPHNNKDAVLIKLKSEEELVRDAAEELMNAMGNDDNDEIEWSESDYILLQSCLGLVKTAKICFKKVIESIDSDGNSLPGPAATDLDLIWSSSENISSAVDDFVLSLYPPIEKLTVNELSKSLFSKLRNLVDTVRSTHLYKDDENDWIDFLANAIKHNYEKVQKMTDQKRAG